MDGVRETVSFYKDYIWEPRKYEKYSPELFDIWKDRAEIACNASRQIDRSKQRWEKVGSSVDKLDQEAFTEDFFRWWYDYHIKRDYQAWEMHIALNEEVNASATQKRKEFKRNEKDEVFSVDAKETEFTRAYNEYIALVESIEWMLPYLNE